MNKVNKGVLISNKGERIEIPGKIISNKVKKDLDGKIKNETTIEYNILGGGSKSVNDTDGAISYQAYLTIFWESNSSGNILLTGVAGYWVQLGANNTSVQSAVLKFGCSAVGIVGQSDIRYPSNNFYYSTGYTQYAPPNAYSSAIGANLRLTLVQSSRTWSFTLLNNY